jgi:hypothetical protein
VEACSTFLWGAKKGGPCEGSAEGIELEGSALGLPAAAAAATVIAATATAAATITATPATAAATTVAATAATTTAAATTVTATATAAAATATATAATTEGGAFFTWAGFVDCEGATHPVFAVEFFDGSFHAFTGAHGDEAETARAAAVTVHDDCDFCDFAVLAEEFADVEFGRVEGKIPDVHFSVDHNLSGLPDVCFSELAPDHRG